MKKENIYNIPNALSVSRFFFAIGILYTLIRGYLGLSTVLYLVGAITDFLDGEIARKYHQETKIGKILDASGDRVLVLFTVVGLFIANLLSTYVLIIIVLWGVMEAAFAIFITIRNKRLWLRYVHRNSVRFAAFLVFLAVGWNILRWPYLEVVFWITFVSILFVIADYFCWIVGKKFGRYIILGDKKEKIRL